MSWWVVDIGLIVSTVLFISLMLRENFHLTRNEKIYAVAVGVAYFVFLGLLCRQIFELSQFPPMMEMQ